MREAVLDETRFSYIARSCYHAQLTRFLEHYPMERILILEQDELMKGIAARRSGACSASSRAPSTPGAGNPDPVRDLQPPATTPRRWRPSGCRSGGGGGLRNRRPFAFPFEQPEIEEKLHAGSARPA